MNRQNKLLAEDFSAHVLWVCFQTVLLLHAAASA